jgi:cytoskeleton protein RodZ
VVAQPAISVSVSPSPPAAANPAPAASPTASASVPAGYRTLRLTFTGESWVEIKDGKGKTLISRVSGKGSDAEVSGRPPFTVWIGNAPEVKMYYNDKEFDLAAHTRVAVARFTLE